MNLAMVMFGHINTDTGICGRVGRDSPKLCMQHVERPPVTEWLKFALNLTVFPFPLLLMERSFMTMYIFIFSFSFPAYIYSGQFVSAYSFTNIVERKNSFSPLVTAFIQLILVSLIPLFMIVFLLLGSLRFLSRSCLLHKQK